MPRLGFASPALGLVIANIFIPIALLVFATGFFPYKPFLPGFALRDESLSAVSSPFDKVIFMVVDALRSDFVFSKDSGFVFTQSLIRDGSAMPFTAHATSPTITMPRVKAITTGSIPSFLDVILNFAESDTTSTLADQDTWLAQMKLKEDGKKLIMFGDDTWLKLFPYTFDRADGTSSFFVSDFTEVDNNVTRHIPGELQNEDWNTMVLHYLGLDHIGHKAGPRSPHMIPKQREMDQMVRTIYEALQSQKHLESTLLVLCGDHGMNDAGNHGGSAPGETSPALVFIAPKLRDINKPGAPCPTEESNGEFQFYSTIEQSDVAPTLGALLGFPIPLNNLGVIIPQMMGFWSDSDKVSLMRGNARQIYEIVKATFSPSSLGQPSTDCSSTSSHAEELACRWLSTTVPDQDAGASLKSLSYFSKRAQEVMSSTASNYDLSRLNLGITLAGISFLFASLSYITLFYQRSSPTIYLVLILSASYSGMLFASSYVEEEQHFWYWTTSAWCIFLAIRSARHTLLPTPSSLFFLTLAPIPLLALHRLAIRFNQTGQKHTSAPDIAHTFFTAHNHILLVLVLATYLSLFRNFITRCFPPSTPRIVRVVISFTLVVSSLAFKFSFVHADAPELLRSLTFPPFLSSFLARSSEPSSLIAQARTVFIALLATFLYSVFSSPSFKPPRYLSHDLLTLLLLTQTRLPSIPLYLIFDSQLSILLFLPLSTPEISLSALLLSHTAFFAMGGSNAISSIDLSSAYNGVSGYNVLAVGILTFVSNWAGTIWWVSGANILLLQSKDKDSGRTVKGRLWSQHVAVQTFFVTAGMVGVMVACMLLRQHLFVWTVFSPKYLYSGAWGVGGHLATSLGLGAFLYWLGGGWSK